jgi:ornithine cyclodeaminase
MAAALDRLTGEPLVLSGEELRRRVPYRKAVQALRDAFRELDPGQQPERTHLSLEAGELLLMPAASATALGVKLLTVADGSLHRGVPNIQGVFILFSAGTLTPVAVIDGAALTALRTAAVSALATDVLARTDAYSLVVFGAGVQGRAHLEAMCAVRDVGELVVVDRPELAERMVAAASANGLTARVGGPRDVRQADIVCACTTSPTPLFDGQLLPERCHVNAIGSYRPDRRELDDSTMARALVVVEHRATALRHAGDIVMAIRAGAVAVDRVTELCDVLNARRDGRSAEPLTVFKSVGLALEDLAVAQAALES